jgi:hypothetical protein
VHMEAARPIELGELGHEKDEGAGGWVRNGRGNVRSSA